MVFASLPLHAFFGVVLMSTNTVLGESFYKSLQLYWHTDLLGDQRLGGGIAWAAGEIPLVVVMIALLVQWTRSDGAPPSGSTGPPTATTTLTSLPTTRCWPNSPSGMRARRD